MALENSVLVNQGFTAGAKTLSSFTLSGSDRIVVVWILMNDGSGDLTSVTLNSVGMTDLGSVNSGGPNRIVMHYYYMGEGDLPGNGSYDIVATPSSQQVIQLGAMCLSGRADQTPEATNTTASSNANSYANQITTLTANADVIGAAAQARFATNTHTQSGDLSEESENDDTYTMAHGFFADGAAGTVDHDGSFSAASRDCISVALAFGEAAAAAAPFLPFYGHVALEDQRVRM